MPDPLHALVLGIVEGLTEFLPVSSTAHLILVSHFLGLETSEFLKSFEIIIQLGAILAVLAIYGRTLVQSRELWGKIIAAFVPTAVIGLVFYNVIKTYLLASLGLVTWVLGLGGLALILFEAWYRHRIAGESSLEQITYRQAVLIGCAQSLAIVPGVSRAAATILGGLALGLPRRTIVEFSFLLALPTVAAATGLDLIKNVGAFSLDQFGALAIGFLSSFLVAYLAIKYFLRYIQQHDFTSFGIYRVALALLVIMSL